MEQKLQRYIFSVNELQKKYTELSGSQKQGITHIVIGALIFGFGISFFFQSLLLSLGNGIIIYGIIELFGIDNVISFLRAVGPNSGNYGALIIGISLILTLNGWGLIGFLLEVYGIFQLLKERFDNQEINELLKAFHQIVADGLRLIPVIKAFLSQSKPINEVALQNSVTDTKPETQSKAIENHTCNDSDVRPPVSVVDNKTAQNTEQKIASEQELDTVKQQEVTPTKVTDSRTGNEVEPAERKETEVTDRTTDSLVNETMAPPERKVDGEKVHSSKEETQYVDGAPNNDEKSNISDEQTNTTTNNQCLKTEAETSSNAETQSNKHKTSEVENKCEELPLQTAEEDRRNQNEKNVIESLSEVNSKADSDNVVANS